MTNFNKIEQNLNAKERKKKQLDAKKPDFYKETGRPYAEMDDHEYDGHDIFEEEEINGTIETLKELETQTKSELTEEEQKFAEFRFKNLRSVLSKQKEKEGELAFLKIHLEKLIDKELKNKKSDTFVRNSNIDKVDDKINKLKVEIKELTNENPESFYATHIQEIKKHKQKLEAGKLVEVPYVRDKLDDIIKNMKIGSPVFLHGHLGSGKSFSAYAAAKEFMVDQNIQKDFNEWYQKEIKKLKNNKERTVSKFNNKTKEFKDIIVDKIDKKEIIQKLKELENFYKTDDSKKTQEKLSFYAISGSKETEVSDLYTTKSLGLEKVNGKSMQEHVETLSEERKKWLDSSSKKLDSLNEKEKKNAIKQGFKDISKAYEMKYSGFGTVVEDIKMELRKAIEEGRPFVFDEINALPSGVLISMNDLLTKKPGEDAFIPGVGNVKIAKGFSMIFTGNMNFAGMAEYHGVQELNPAFLSRLKNIEFDYPPQRVDGTLNSASEGKNELFKILIAKSVDKNGNINLPKDSLEKLYKLAVYAAKAQKLFSGKWKESKVGEVDGIEPRLEQSVLSVRALSDILDKWSAGREVDLDMAIWKEFIDNATVPADKRILFKIAQDVGFFKESSGWKLDDIPINDSSLLNLDDVQDESYKFTKQESKFISAKEVVKTLYGNPPERTKFPDFSTDEKVEEPKIDTKSFQELNDFIENIKTEKYKEASAEVCGIAK